MCFFEEKIYKKYATEKNNKEQDETGDWQNIFEQYFWDVTIGGERGAKKKKYNKNVNTLNSKN